MKTDKCDTSTISNCLIFTSTSLMMNAVVDSSSVIHRILKITSPAQQNKLAQTEFYHLRLILPVKKRWISQCLGICLRDNEDF